MLELIKCNGCWKQIKDEDVSSGNVVGVLDRLYHKSHIYCIYCNRKIQDKLIFPSKFDESRPACYDCHVQTRNPACSACSEPLANTAIAAYSGRFHRSCFKCSVCKQIIPKGKGFYEKENQIMDQKCFLKKGRK